MPLARLRIRAILMGLGPLLNHSARRHAGFATFLRRHDVVAQIQLKDGSLGRHYVIAGGNVRSRAGLHAGPDVSLVFKDEETALAMLRPHPDMAEVVHAAKNFKIVVKGQDALAVWFMQALNYSQAARVQMGTELPDGTRRYTTLTNGGPMFVHVRDGRIVRQHNYDCFDPF